MKTRHGFVSNSSSSSFVCFVKGTVLDEALACIPKSFANAILQQSQGPTSFCGVELVSISWTRGNYSSFEDTDLSIEESEIASCTLLTQRERDSLTEFPEDTRDIFNDVLTRLVNDWIKNGNAIGGGTDF